MRVVGSVANALSSETEGTQFYSVSDKIGVKHLGDTVDKSDVRFNKWVYNNCIDFDVALTHTSTGIDVTNKTITTVDAHSIKKLS